MVHFVGAGPGACDLITVRGKKYIEEADVIIYAGSLVNPQLLEYSKDGCIIKNSAYMTLEEVIEAIALAGKENKMVVRLHTGDPSIYGAIREQMDELDKLGIKYDVCPGVSSFCGAAASLNLEYTLPEVSQSVVITRQAGRTPVPERESIKAFAAHRSTMVLFLSAGMATELKNELLEGGYSESCPVAVVYKATWPEEKIIRSTVGRFDEDMRAAGISKTALIIVGEVAEAPEKLKYDKSRLYAADFSTEYREAGKK